MVTERAHNLEDEQLSKHDARAEHRKWSQSHHDGNAQQRDPDDQRDTQGEHVQLPEQPGVPRGAN
jgi:hypothetical protein